MKKIIMYSVLLIVYCLFVITPVYADYVLPYPSFMPGNKLYRVSRIIDTLKQYWYFGNIAKIKYHLGLSDKYLVEAKTLMEYKQYLLATDAVKRSDAHIAQIPLYVKKADGRRIDTTGLRKTIREASETHIVVLHTLLGSTPEEFIWTPEKQQSTHLKLKRIVEESITIRNDVLLHLSL